MAYRNKFDRSGQSFQMGKKAEDTFKELLIKNGYKIQNSSKKEDIAHIDIWVIKNDEKVSFEIKAAKKISREEPEVNYNFIFVEFCNVLGKDGWLMTGAEYLAFEQPDNTFLIVSREDLKKWCQTKCNITDIVQYPEDCLYKGYTRSKWGRNDLISLIKVEDLKKSISFQIWK